MTVNDSHLPIPERIQRLRDELFATPDSTCFARAHLVTASYRQTEGAHAALRRAQALYTVFDQMPIFIRPGELLVGQRASKLGARSVYPEYHLHGLTAETTPAEIWDYWHGRTLGETVRATFPERLRLAEQEMAAGHVTGTDSGFGHVIVDYDKALRLGFEAIIDEAQALLDEAPPDDAEGRAFLQAAILSCRGIIRWAERYAELAERTAESCTDPVRAAELRHIAQVCRRVPAQPARTFQEALQCFWLVHTAMHIEQYGWSISAGRFDQYIYPYYRHDLVAGALREEDAWELLLNLWVKFMENVGTRIKETVFQNLTLGGQDEQGNDQSNALSHLCLDATLALRLNQPALSLRWHPRIDPGFWQHAHRIIAAGLGLPALFSDEVIIPALVAHGVAPQDAVGYGIVGCVEACIPGQMQAVTAGGHVNLAKALELALNEGRSMLTDRQIGEPTTAPESWACFDDLWASYATQVRYLASLNVLAATLSGQMHKYATHCPLMSCLLDDCLLQRRDMVWGGTRYNLPGTGIYGPSNVYDGMSAIRQRVCEERKLTWAELRQVLLDDFRGHEDVRQMLSRGVPRFGNDLAEIDDLANRINAIHADFLWQHVDARNGRFTCGVWPVTSHVAWGTWTAATPDGRHAGETLVDGVGACHGADRSGPTALLRSVARLDNIGHWSAGNTCNIKFSPATVAEEQGAIRLADLSEVFMSTGGQELQINVISGETLRQAQRHPEAYTDLIVRVAGFSAYFTQLQPNVQEEIISRTEHSL